MRLGEAFPYGSRVAVAWMPPGAETAMTFTSRAMPGENALLFLEPPASGETPTRFANVQIVREDGAYAVRCDAVFVGEDDEGWLCFKAVEIDRHPKRRYFRVSAQIPVSLPNVKIAQTQDISGAGAMVEVAGGFPYEDGDLVDGVLCLPDAPIQITFRVVRHRAAPGGVFVALDFHRIADEDREKIIVYTVERQRGMVRTM